MATAGLYRRLLPCPPAVEFASSQGKVSLSVSLSLSHCSIMRMSEDGNFLLVSSFYSIFLCSLNFRNFFLKPFTMEPWKAFTSWFPTSKHNPSLLSAASLACPWSSMLSPLILAGSGKVHFILLSLTKPYLIKFIGQNSLNPFEKKNRINFFGIYMFNLT